MLAQPPCRSTVFGRHRECPWTNIAPLTRMIRRCVMTIIYRLSVAALAVATVSAWPQTAAPTAPQIAAIVVAANQVDIDAGELAKSKSAATDVKEFAQRMITDHSGVNKSATELVHKLHVKPESNPTSQSLQQGGEQNIAALQNL